ncbi:helix-turn-helix domain-containing protein [Agarivorans sp.]|uniref:AraC family transcriptional regulator n=1 Tax=Agarivorans sp. TaxID=1872412 RepID=UPI003D07DE31
MLSIPLPFIAAFLLFLIIVVLRFKEPHLWKKPTAFIILCIVTMIVVGLRWTTDFPFLRALQPILGACLPVAAWLSFSEAHKPGSHSFVHWLGPLIVALCSFSYPHLWPAIIDYLIPLLSLGYGLVLIKSSFALAEGVPLHKLSQVSLAEKAAGILLIISALIDSSISYDFFMFGGEHAHLILSVSYLILIPAIAVMVAYVGICSPLESQPAKTENSTLLKDERESIQLGQRKPPTLDADEISSITTQFERFMRETEAFKDASLTLNKIARKLGIPTRKISFAVNQKYGKNISKLINAYRINHAQQLLINSDMTITDVYLSSGFQTKSNFHREFSRITGLTPSEFRLRHLDKMA